MGHKKACSWQTSYDTQKISNMLLPRVLNPTTSLRKTSNQFDRAQTLQVKCSYEEYAKQHQVAAKASMTVSFNSGTKTTPTTKLCGKKLQNFHFRTYILKDLHYLYHCHWQNFPLLYLVERIKGLGLTKFLPSLQPSKVRKLKPSEVLQEQTVASFQNQTQTK